MAQIILDMGSGNTCRNSISAVNRMIDLVAAGDRGRHGVILKWQLFDAAPPNVPLDRKIFDHAYLYARQYGFKTASSVFDSESLSFLLGYEIPFVKIACRPELYSLADEVPPGMPVYISVVGIENPFLGLDDITPMWCIPKYPADREDYESLYTPEQLGEAVSDHTRGLGLIARYHPQIVEKHFVHERRPDNPDAGEFAIEPYELGEVLNADF